MSVHLRDSVLNKVERNLGSYLTSTSDPHMHAHTCTHTYMLMHAKEKTQLWWHSPVIPSTKRLEVKTGRCLKLSILAKLMMLQVHRRSCL